MKGAGKSHSEGGGDEECPCCKFPDLKPAVQFRQFALPRPVVFDPREMFWLFAKLLNNVERNRVWWEAKICCINFQRWTDKKNDGIIYVDE
ncbi:hypothetical protein E2C01_086880 [Portunus trituberculatus]|uniref:Uncharacterized protein n=1 Tax=Portunus trituberculatus TaxID=210409 RepID=A0A5B7J513_PORTR|nr:hypothetical protein [Portunus trituberculatus]